MTIVVEKGTSQTLAEINKSNEDMLEEKYKGEYKNVILGLPNKKSISRLAY